MDKASFSDLFNRYLEDRLSSTELRAFREAASQATYQEYLDELLEDTVGKELPYSSPEEVDLQHIRRYLMTTVVRPATPAHRIHFLRKWGWVAASILLLAVAVTTFLLLPVTPVTPIVKNADIQPGKAGAILTLADGSQVVLDSLGNGVVASQNGAQAVLQHGGLTYAPAGQLSGEVVYNTMTTPKGRQFQVTLPDGTRVWLNSASWIRYPTVFTGNERRVTVEGEAYFEVAKNTRMPFRVNINDKAEIQVLGTHFNVNAYKDEEQINTTLLEGSLKVNGTIIRPGQQAQVPIVPPAGGSIQVINNIDIDKVMAWKNGLFNFEGASLEDVMRQLERWYDIEVVYEKNIPDIRFEGKMARDIPLSGLLVALERSDVHYRIEGRKLVVLP